MRGSVEDSAPKLKLKFLKMEFSLRLKPESMQMRKPSAKKSPGRQRRWSRELKLNIGLTALSLFHPKRSLADQIINSYSLGKTAKVSLRDKTLGAKYTFSTFYQIPRDLNFQFSAAKPRTYKWSPHQQVMLLSSGLKTMWILQVKAIMESMHANTFNCKAENRESSFQYLTA